MTSWIIAFLVHSTLWLGIAWLWTRLRPGMHARVRETIWYTAIAASIVTPTFQTFMNTELAVWRVPVAAAEHSWLSASEHGSGWQHALPWIWLVAASLLLLMYGVRLFVLRSRLRTREVIKDKRARALLARLCDRAGLSTTPLLTENDDLGSPIALGFGHRTEICVPTRALHELDEDQLEAMLGHEVAHHLRRDTIRLGALNMLRAVLFFQPLVGLATRAIHRAAEEQCDDWAARQIDDRFAMASCLTEVAAWLLPRDRRVPVPCMARRRSQLGVRVDRLLDERRTSGAPAGIRRGIGVVAVLVLAPWLAPAVAPAGEPQRVEHYDHEHHHEHGHHESHGSRKDGH